MYTTIQKWGNRKVVRLPKAMLELVNLNENDKVLFFMFTISLLFVLILKIIDFLSAKVGK